MHIFRILAVTLPFSAALLTSACATQRLNSEISYESSTRRELSVPGTQTYDPKTSKDIELPGHYCGLTKIGSSTYFAIEIDDIRINCGNHHSITLLIPTTPGATGMLRETDKAIENASGDVRVIIPWGTYQGWNSDENYNAILSWSNYPNTVVLNISPLPTVRYLLSENINDIAHAKITNDLNWECRSNIKYFSLHVLYPFSVAYDVVTVPIQWLLWQIWH